MLGTLNTAFSAFEVEMRQENAPNNTIYIHNLNEKVVTE